MKAKLSIKDFVNTTDLRTINWQRARLNYIVRTRSIGDGECIVFENKARNKARIVANFNGMPILLIPPIDHKRQLSTHLEVNLFLRAMAGGTTTVQAFDDNVTSLEERIAARTARRKAAASRRRKEQSNG